MCNTLLLKQWQRERVSVLTVIGKLLVLFKYPARTAQKTLSVSVTKTSQLVLYREIMAICSEIHTKHINTAVWAERGIVEC